ncbi:DsbE family thiol:disulfide interchange protein [Oceanospirillum sediminis]|uniref:DsbE family thiol:disulfide interchange protein n=1 Tax=Oceanospirillum sediminis TaxID=2760088 RepID=A0A839IMI9_9GAMM|nr:DsbE family thiol:disulfide interchange protein [Oceanospirillum sediminis]MBB1485687.1 DsbE family thiol:disulfide interchange protein [Oceanospirillum sediminis]
MKRRLILFIPLIVALVLGLFLWQGLKLDPRELPSALIGKPFPEFTLSTVQDKNAQMTQDALKGQVSLVNVWATWCVSCRQEHPELVRIAKETGIPVFGLNYKDTRPEAIRWLDEYLDPYQFSLFDADGRVGLDLGVYGAPETYILDKDGIIRYRFVGVIDRNIWLNELLPEVNKWR